MNLALSNLYAVLSIFGCGLAILYLGALEWMIMFAIFHGSSTLTFDLLEPAEAAFVIPFVFFALTLTIVGEMQRLSR